MEQDNVDNGPMTFRQEEQAASQGKAHMSDPPIPPILTYLGLGKEKIEETEEEQYREILHSGAWPRKVATVRKLEQMKEQAPVELLLIALKDAHPAVRTAAVRTLGLMGEKAPIEPLVSALEDRVWHVRAAGAVALGKQSPRAPVEPLLKAMHDEDESVREAATWAVSTLGQQAPLDVLIAALKHQERDSASSVRETAARALESLGVHTPQKAQLAASADSAETASEAAEQDLSEAHPEISKRREIQTEPLNPKWVERNTEPVNQVWNTEEDKGQIWSPRPHHPVEFPDPWHNPDITDNDPIIGQRTEKRRGELILEEERANGHLHHQEADEKEPIRNRPVIGRVVPFKRKNIIEQGLVAAVIVGIALAWLLLNLGGQHSTPGSGNTGSKTATTLHYTNPSAVTRVVWAPQDTAGGKKNPAQIAFADAEGNVQVLDIASKQVIATYGRFNNIVSLAWSNDGLHIATLSTDGMLQLIRGGEQVPMLNISQVGTNPLLAWSPDGQRIAVGLNRDGKHVIQVWDLTTKSRITTHASQFGAITSIAWSRDSKNIATAYDDGNVRIIELWNVAKGTRVKYPEPIPYVPVPFRVVNMAWAPDGVHLAYTLTDGEVRVWDSDTYNHQLFNIDTSKSSTNQIVSSILVWSPDGKTLLSTTMSSVIKVWDTTTGTLLSSYKGHSAVVNDIAWSQDGKNIVSVSQDGDVIMWQNA